MFHQPHKGGNTMITNSVRIILLQKYLEILESSRTTSAEIVTRSGKDVEQMLASENMVQRQECSDHVQPILLSNELLKGISVANEQIQMLKRDLSELEKRLVFEKISLYSIVMVEYEDTTKKTFILVRGNQYQKIEDSSNGEVGVLGIETPMGKSLYGKEKNDEIFINNKEVSIIEVS